MIQTFHVARPADEGGREDSILADILNLYAVSDGRGNVSILFHSEVILIHTVPAKSILFDLGIGVDYVFLVEASSVVESLESAGTFMEIVCIIRGL